MVTVQATKNSLQALQSYGQSVWLDYIRRSLITSGELQRLIEQDGLRGVTSNPSIFEKAIVRSTDYDTTWNASEHSQDRDVMSLHLGGDIDAGLAVLKTAISKFCKQL